MTNFGLFQTQKEFADDNFKFDENGRKLSKQIENTVGKGEIARYEQFLLFPQCFQKACFPEASKGVIVWEWVKEGVCYRKSLLPYLIYPVPDMPILGSSNSAANKDIMSKIWTNVDTIF